MKNKQSNLLLCLEGLSSNDVRNMMNYMYNGELQICQDDLDRFINVAQRFKLEGLISDPDAVQEEEVNFKKSEHFDNKETNFQDDLGYRTKTKPEGHERLITKVSTDIYPANISEVDEQIEQNIVKNLDGSYSCKICGKTSGKNHKDNVKNHIETHLEGLSFNCTVCEKTFRSRGSLAKHKLRNHRNNLK